MSKINCRVAAFATSILSLGFAAAGAAPTLASVERTQILPREAVHRQVDSRLARPGYAGPASSSRMAAASCDLPSSGCLDNERVTN